MLMLRVSSFRNFIKILGLFRTIATYIKKNEKKNVEVIVIKFRIQCRYQIQLHHVNFRRL